MKYFKYILLCFSFVIVSCSDDNSLDLGPSAPHNPEDSTQPVFEYTKEKKYLFKMNLYSDVLRFFKYNTRVKQTNPHTSISDNVLKEMEDSINSIVTFPVSWYPQEAIVNDIGFEINENTFDQFSLGIAVDTAKAGEVISEDKYVTKKYAIYGRDSLINLFNRQNFTGHFTTFEDRPTTFRPVIKADFRNNLTGLEDGESAYFGFCDKKIDYSSDIQVPSEASFKLPSILKKPDILINEHALAYDRFDDREYLTEDGTQYKTKVVVKKLVDMKDFDKDAPCPEKPNLTKEYPVMQFYKNGNLWLEAWISKYAECFEYDRSNNQTETSLEFHCYTLKDGYHYWIEYNLMRFTIYVSDFSKQNGSDKFTRVSVDHIQITKDQKKGAKNTISIQ